MKAADLRARVEAALGAEFSLAFAIREKVEPEHVSTGTPEIDALTGGLPRGCLTEVVGPASSGRTSMLVSVLAEITARGEVAALVDSGDAFDPHSAQASGVELNRLLWVRCGRDFVGASLKPAPTPCPVEQALKVTDWLLHSGDFGLVAVDLGDVPPRTARRVPLTSWFRFRRAVEDTSTILVVLEQEPHAKTCASLVLRLDAGSARWSTMAEGVRNLKFENRTSLGKGLALPGKVMPADARHPGRSEGPFRCFKGAKPCRGYPPHASLLEGAQLRVEAVRSRPKLETRKSKLQIRLLYS